MPELPSTLVLSHGTLVLRDWHDGDAAAFAPVCGDWDVCTFTSVPWNYSQASAESWFARLAERRREGTGLALAITRTDGEQPTVPVGNVNLVRFSDDGRQAALGYWLVPAARGQGLASAATRLLCGWGFENLDLERIEFTILPHNVASHLVALSVGATHDGLRRDSHEAAGQLWDMIIYSLSPDGLRR